MKKIFFWLIIIGGGLFVAEIGWLFYYYTSPLTDDSTEKVVLISPGSFKSTVDFLAEEGIVTEPQRFYLLGRLARVSNKVRVGEYKLRLDMSPREILETITSGKSVLHPVNIPEGFNAQQISEVLARKNLVNPASFLKKIYSKKTAEKYGITSPHLEGYLFPDTYSFTRFTGEDKIIDTMVKRFKAVYTQDVEKAANRMGWTMHQVVTLASVVEKETGASEERPIIASVFHNRLRIKMKLQSDPTVIYGKKGNKKNITRKDLRTKHPYNTYTNKGLPIGPIANPGRESLIAIVEPASTKYLYFVSKNQGTHYFSTNLKEHNRAVRQYQLSKSARKGKSWRDRLKKSK